jgi:hypothetical protein
MVESLEAKELKYKVDRSNLSYQNKQLLKSIIEHYFTPIEKCKNRRFCLKSK